MEALGVWCWRSANPERKCSYEYTCSGTRIPASEPSPAESLRAQGVGGEWETSIALVSDVKMSMVQYSGPRLEGPAK